MVKPIKASVKHTKMPNSTEIVQPVVNNQEESSLVHESIKEEDEEEQEQREEETPIENATVGEQTDSDAYDTDLDVEDDMPKAYTSMTGKDIYLRSCEQLGVVPASYFLAHMNNPSLNMSHHGLGPRGAKAISPPLVVNTSITDLNIEDNWITADGTKDLADMLLENCYIADLNMSQNKLGSKGAEYMCDMLMENTTLRSVNLSANDFKDKDAMYFADAFRANFKLKEFDLSKNAFCELGGEWLGQGIAANESIEYLNLSWNHLRLKGALAVCAGMKINITIKKLDLSWNGFANDGAAAMAEALKTNNTLTWLDLSHNRITGEGARLLAKGLSVNDTLRTLKIGNNPIDADGALALLRAIADNEKSAMEDLDLTGVSVNEEFKLLAQELAQRSRGSSSRHSFRYNINRTEDLRTDFDSCGMDADPMDVLQDFLEKKRLRLIDLFRNFDKDLSWKISPKEFKNGIKNAGIRMGNQQMRQLMSNLDYDVDGQINYNDDSPLARQLQ
ncbi:uncharacterized protein LOC120346351 isoform X2 [Styela clava]|uniref:leucine-rich repeat-containing protein 74A-like isoform X2 n=1 Tax=Styela clava TaxID=7725 RepID=UPI00193958A6|nr:leucine-rich repeat-containing protein 74A-like isoform X2 [Styela clava]